MRLPNLLPDIYHCCANICWCWNYLNFLCVPNLLDSASMFVVFFYWTRGHPLAFYRASTLILWNWLYAYLCVPCPSMPNQDSPNIFLIVNYIYIYKFILNLQDWYHTQLSATIIHKLYCIIFTSQANQSKHKQTNLAKTSPFAPCSRRYALAALESGGSGIFRCLFASAFANPVRKRWLSKILLAVGNSCTLPGPPWFCHIFLNFNTKKNKESGPWTLGTHDPWKQHTIPVYPCPEAFVKELYFSPFQYQYKSLPGPGTRHRISISHIALKCAELGLCQYWCCNFGR